MVWKVETTRGDTLYAKTKDYLPLHKDFCKTETLEEVNTE